MVTTDIQIFKILIGKKIKALREAKGLSVRKFAVLADMEHHQILSIEKGNTDIRLSTLVKISNALGVTPVELIQ